MTTHTAHTKPIRTANFDVAQTAFIENRPVAYEGPHYEMWANFVHSFAKDQHRQIKHYGVLSNGAEVVEIFPHVPIMLPKLPFGLSAERGLKD